MGRPIAVRVSLDTHAFLWWIADSEKLADVFLAVEFHALQRPVDAPCSGPYQGRDELTPEDIRVVMEREYMSQTEMMRTLETLVSTVNSLKQSINWRLPLTMGLIMSVIMTTVTLVMTLVVTLAL